MKKKSLLIAILAVIILALAGAWFWHGHIRATDDSLADVKSRGVLVVGSDIPFGVMEFFDSDNKPAGIDVEIAETIASRLGVRLEFRDEDWPQLFYKIKDGSVDLAISSITITPERQAEILFSRPYFTGGQVIIVRTEDQEIKGINNLANKKIAVQAGTTSYSEAKKYTNESLISTYPSFGSANGGTNITDGLKDGKFDAIIVDYIQALDMIKYNLGLKIVGVPFTKESYGIAAKPGNVSLVQEVDSILKEMADDGTLEKIETKWTRF
jgi:polar amino acid transport system substrate-binding protein